MDSRYQALGLPPRFVDESFDTFSAGSYVTEKSRYHTLTAAMGKAKRFVDEFPISRNKGLLFHGGSPTEQTHLAVATLKCFVDKGFSGMYCDYHQLMLTLRARSDPNSAIAEASRETARRLVHVDVLLVDSLGDHRPTEWTLDTVGGIIKHRYYHEKCLLATTGLPLEARPRVEPDGFIEMRSYRPVNDALSDRIGQESVYRLLDHCDPICMTVPEPRPPGPAPRRTRA